MKCAARRADRAGGVGRFAEPLCGRGIGYVRGHAEPCPRHIDIYEGCRGVLQWAAQSLALHNYCAGLGMAAQSLRIAPTDCTHNRVNLFNEIDRGERLGT